MSLRLCLSLLVICLLLGVPAGGIGHVSAKGPAETAPGLTAQAIRSDLFAAQAALLAADPDMAAAAVAEATAAAEPLLRELTADETAAAALRASLAEASAAVAANDPAALAVAQGSVRAIMARGAYAETVAAAAAGDADTASAWLLLRDFRATTRYDRPNADATLALQELRQGAITPEQAAEAIRADLLDTYQARLESTLNELLGATPGALFSSQAESVGLASGYWPLLAPAFAEQLGDEARADADHTFSTLLAAADNHDAAAFSKAQTDATEIVQSFRAAPLTEMDKARRTGQLLRYLSLIPMEYGRGVKQGQVLLDLEIQEARAFLDGARAAFADLRLPLREIDAAETAAIAASLENLDTALAATA